MSQKVEHTVDDHIRYTNEEITKNLALLEGHFKVYPCGECINKHLLTIQGLAEEGMGMDGKEPYESIRRWAKRAMTREDLQKLYVEARDLRRKVQPSSHDYAGEIRKHLAENHGVTAHEQHVHQVA